MTKDEILAIAKPILFNTQMTRAIMDGRKTQTRRVIKPRYCDSVFEMYKEMLCEVSCDERGLKALADTGDIISTEPLSSWDPVENPNEIMTEMVRFYVPCKPRYKVGDYLYVRETWCRYSKLDNCECVIENTECFYYRADGENPTPYNRFLVQHSGWDEHRETPEWCPSIHMPKEAARTFLQVTGVMAERLQKIDEEGAKAEGAINNVGFINSPENEYNRIHSAREHFVNIWNSTVKKSDLPLYGWDANPWVWAYDFKKVEVEDRP
jgi:hypothetical protein